MGLKQSTSLRIVVMLLGAWCVLLLAGALPWGGVEAVYRGGLVRVLGGGAGVLCLWAAWTMSAGHRLRMVLGIVLLFFAVAGVGVLLCYGQESLRYADMGGAMWFGAVGMGCLAMVGLLFSVIFGYLAHLSLRVDQLWLAVAHLSIAMVVAGAFVDVCTEQRFSVVRYVGETRPTQGKKMDSPMPFEVEVKSLQVERHESAGVYNLLEHRVGRWTPIAAAVKQGERIRCGKEEWNVADLRVLPGGQGRCFMLPGEPVRVLVQQSGPVKEYRAVCRFVPVRKRDEEREETLRVNEPATWRDWRIYLMSCSPDARQVQLLLRRAPGRMLVFAGLVGVLLCSFARLFRNELTKTA